jgi:hypothetical protein
VAVALGADPATLLAAVTPVPDSLSEYAFAGLLRGAKTELAPCQTSDLQVPAGAEIILEGTITPGEDAEEGPFGDHTGYYNEVERFPVFTITRITHRDQPIYHSTYTGRPPDEPSILGLALNETVPGNHRFLPAAGRLLLPRRLHQHEKAVPRPCQARHVRHLVVSAPVHVHQVRHRDRRGHRRARLEGRHLGRQHAHGSGARLHDHR